jgi:predicted AAA+ superfamily ATPase
MNRFKDIDAGYKIENLVLLELFNKFDFVYSYKNGDVDIDFIAIKEGTITYFQVTQFLYELDEDKSN